MRAMEHKMVDARSHGVCLYVPAMQKNITKIVCSEKLQVAKNIIICTEDSIDENDLPQALKNIKLALKELVRCPGRYCYIRVRSPEVLAQVLKMKDATKLDGFVLPKVHEGNFSDYWNLLSSQPHRIMPTIETKEAFCEASMFHLLQQFIKPEVKNRILCIRIGGNDLLSLLGIRRPRGKTIYHTPIGMVIAKLITIFRPYGFFLSGPVFEHLNDWETLKAELDMDLNYGLIPKAAIHPGQIEFIEKHYQVNDSDMQLAIRILQSETNRVFSFQNTMCEPATHMNWAENLFSTAQHYGISK
jgi:citrate lyase beta subunit